VDRLRLATGQAADGSLLRVQAEIADAIGGRIDAAAPLEVTVHDPTGTPRYQLSRTAVHGVWDETLPIAANDPPGRWKVTITERMSGMQVSSGVDLSVPSLPRAGQVPAVEWTNAERVREALRRAEHVALVVADNQGDPLAEAIQALEKWLTGKGKKVE